MGFCLFSCAGAYVLLVRWMNPLVFRTMEAVSATSRVAYVMHEKIKYLRTYLKVKSLGKETMAPHSLKITTLVLPSQSPGYKTLLMTDSCNGIALGVTLTKEASFNIRGSKKCNNVMTYLATDEELGHMAGNTVSLHYQITITPTGE